MEFEELIRKRGMVRAFRPDPVPEELVQRLLRNAVRAPSAGNLQPWEFVVVMDEEKDRLSRKLTKAYREKQVSCSSGAVKPLPEAIRQRGIQNVESMQTSVERTRAAIAKAKGIERPT